MHGRRELGGVEVENSDAQGLGSRVHEFRGVLDLVSSRARGGLMQLRIRETQKELGSR